ncbi:4-oxalomesaconate tautomerase [Vibrio coralliilyticus]|uniref:4-oxalomesaconate tautomerase n=1 Tax=Vibrio coralliilyticus TaxID=190893 RepID=UPI000BAC19F9|nr:4-oxalomesaconate tautomerase [Vibrio coralliilyticus]NOI75857.1 4-oxalomesaconate tautomerase [Vibrio coralliilyticus]PAW04095.1 4-oxalomesaconate tautomerase [Vibrio coralliilyticus]
MSSGTPCMWMRAGTSKGAFFLKSDLPADSSARDAFLMSVMGTPDERQIDGIGGADPLTSKVAIVEPSSRDGVDVDYLFLQVFVDQALVSGKQNCGNILAGVAPFAIERGLVEARDGETPVRVFMENTQQIATVTVKTPGKKVTYQGNCCIDGVPDTAAPIAVTFEDIAGSTCGSLLPSGSQVDVIDGVSVTLIDNGMPVVVLKAQDFGLSGDESREQLDANDELKQKLESIRLQAGPLMNLGDVTELSVPKMSLVSTPQYGGAISTRTFIPHRCHASIGVLGAVSVASACILEQSPANEFSSVKMSNTMTLDVEHPIGKMTVVLDVENNQVQSAAILRTARKLFDGCVFGKE